MDIKNTSGYPDARMRELVEFAYQFVGPEKIGRVGQIWVRSKTHGWFSGHFWASRKRIVMSIGSSFVFPLKERHCCKRSKKWPKYCLMDWKEAIVNVMSHEFFHAVQFMNGWKYSEIEAESMAKKATEAYREKQNEKIEHSDKYGEDNIQEQRV